MTLDAYVAGIGELHIASGAASGVPDVPLAGLEDVALAVAMPRKEIVFIEDDVPDIGTLLGGIGRDKQVVILDSRQDGLHQIAQALAGKSGIDAVHVFSHGQAGAVDLGSLILDAGNLDTHKDDLQTVRESMSADGDILLYGCKVGADASFVDRLAIATGADVAASNDLTGAAALGGNWNLEVTSGNIETAPAIDAHAAALYREVLSISPGTLGFDHTAYFAPGVVDPADRQSASTDVVYRVNNNAAYELKIDGASTAVTTYSGAVGQIFSGATAPETALTFSFVGGQLFTPTSIALSNWSGDASENLVIKGYDASGHQVGTSTTYSLYRDYSYLAKTISLASLGGAAVKTLKVTVSSGTIDYVMLDSISIASVAPAPPTVASVTSSTANGSYKAGDVIHVQVAFDQSVAVTGTPTLQLETGTTDRVVSYASGSGTSTLTFAYTVQAGDTSADLDYLSTAALALNGGSIKSTASGTDATLTLPTPGGLGSLGLNAAIVIDTTAPGTPSTPDLTAGTDTGASSSDNVTKNTTPTFTGTAESGSTVKLYDGATLVGSGTATGGNYSITTSTLTNGSHTITATATDAAGNVSTASSGLAVTVDAVAPTVIVSSDASSLKIGETATITFTFSEDPGSTFTWNGSTGDVAVSGGTLSAISGSGLTRTATFTPNANVDNGSASIGVNAASYTDAAGNNGGAGTAATFGYDTKAPTLTITSDKATLKTGDTATITFTFSEDPGATFGWDGSTGDVAVSGGTLSAISGTGTTRTAVFTPDASTNGGTASISVTAGAYADAAGNPGGAGSTPSITFDTLAPSAPSTPQLTAGSDTGISSSDGITNAITPTFTGSAEAGATVTLYDTDGSTVLGSAVATGGTWSIATSTLSEGQHTITAKATDAAGNAGAASSGASVTIDTTAPAAPSAPVPDAAITSDTTPTFSGTAAAGATVKLYDTDGTTVLGSGTADGNGAWSITAASMGEGAHTVTAKATDAAGNTSTASVSHGVTIDTTAPAASSTPVLDPASDTGASHSDGITADTTPTITGTAEAGATVKLYEGSTLLGSTVATGGAWSITSTALGEGQHTVTTTVLDAAGNVSGASSGLTFTIDTTAPTTTVAGIAFSADNGVSGTDFVTNVAAQTISGTLSAALQTGEHVEVSLDNGANWTTAQVSGTTWSLATTLAGGGTLQVRVADAVDNTGPAATQAYVLDTSAPTVTISSDASALKVGDTATIAFTFSEDPGSTFSWDGTRGDVAVSGGTLSAISGTGTTRTAIFTPDANTNGGTASITVSAGSYADAAGNTGGVGTTPSITFDTLAPNAPAAPQLQAASDTGASSADGITSDVTPTVSGSAEAHAAVTLYDGDGTTVLGTTTADAAGAWSITSATLADGSHALRATQTDAAGNVSQQGAALTVTVDTLAPAAALAPALNAASDSGIEGDRITKVNTPTFSGTAEALSQVTLYDTDGQTALGSAQAGADGTWSITASALADGEHTLSVKQVDAAGNASAAGTAFTLTVDTAAPAAPGAPQLQAQSDTGTRGDGITYAMPTLEGTAAANDVVTLYDGTTVVGTTRADANGHWSILAQTLRIGTHTLTATDTDAAGNVSAASGALTLTVIDSPASLVDGVRVTTVPVVLPGGATGTQVDVPIVDAGRAESSGAAGVADIPLATTAGTNLLVAQLATGYGLSASGGANTTVANGGTGLIAAIRAAAASDGSADQGHLVGNGQSYLAQLSSSHALLVETIAPVSTAAPNGSLTLSGSGDPQQHVALVIQAGGLAAGSTIALQNVDFAAVVGAANVVAQSGTQMLTGDAAAQHFTLAAGGSTQVFAGGGDDTMSFGAAATPASASGAVRAQAAPATTLLHGGAGDDTAVFAGARADFDIETHHGYLVVRSKAAPDAQALVVNVEHLQFADATVAVQNGADLMPLTGLYQAVLGRQADVYGLDFWAGVHDKGISLGTIAVNMIGSAERLATQGGFNGDAAHDVGLLYAGLFDRAADTAGLAFWTAAMQHGATLAQVADAMLQSVEMVGQQGTPLDWNFSV